MQTLLTKTPFIAFLFVSIVLTKSSFLFPQKLGNFQRVAGWPLTVYKVDYRIAGDIESTGRLNHWIVSDNREIMWGKLLLNILIWIALLQGTWWFYKKLEEPTANQTSE